MHVAVLAFRSHRVVLGCVRADETLVHASALNMTIFLSDVGICDQDSHLGPAGTWIFALLLGALAALVVACPCLYLERVYLDKYRILLAWLDGPTPRHFGGNSSTVSAMTTRTKVTTLLFRASSAYGWSRRCCGVMCWRGEQSYLHIESSVFTAGQFVR